MKKKIRLASAYLLDSVVCKAWKISKLIILLIDYQLIECRFVSYICCTTPSSMPKFNSTIDTICMFDFQNSAYKTVLKYVYIVSDQSKVFICSKYNFMYIACS